MLQPFFWKGTVNNATIARCCTPLGRATTLEAPARAEIINRVDPSCAPSTIPNNLIFVDSFVQQA
jgi:hypothetical protein